MAVFSHIRIILQKRVSVAGQLFPFSHVWNDRPAFSNSTRLKRVVEKLRFQTSKAKCARWLIYQPFAHQSENIIINPLITKFSPKFYSS